MMEEPLELRSASCTASAAWAYLSLVFTFLKEASTFALGIDLTRRFWRELALELNWSAF